jgi:hypothetical protein
MHPLRQLQQLRLHQQIVLHEDHEDVVEEMIVEEEPELVVDDHGEADGKNERNQNLNKKSSVSDE